MAEAKKKEKPRTTGKGKFQFAYLQKPDFKYVTDGGEFKVKLNQAAELAQPIVDLVTPLMTEAYEEAKVTFKAKYAEEKSKAKREKMKKPVRADAPFTTEDDGTITLSFKMKAKGKNRTTNEEYTRAPVLYDAQANVITKELKIGNGTIGKVSYFIKKFFIEGTGQAGVSLKLVAAQILELKEWGADASYHGFSKEDGFAGEGEDTAEDDDTPTFDDDDAPAATTSTDGKSADEF